MEILKLYIVVLYKTSIKDCLTIQSFIQCKLFENKNNRFIFWDNSPNPNIYDNQNYCKQLGDNILYESHPENTSLALVYNNCISRNLDCDIVCIFDQDSQINKIDYEKYLDDVLNKNPTIPVFLPQIYSNGKLYSPGKFWVFKGWHYKQLSEGIHKDKLYTAIMSGAIVRIDAIKKYKLVFNEELQLYGIDTCFFIDLRQYDCSFYLLKTELIHDLSEKTLNKNEYKKRINIYLNCNRIIARDNGFYLFIIFLYKIFLRIFKKI